MSLILPDTAIITSSIDYSSNKPINPQISAEIGVIEEKINQKLSSSSLVEVETYSVDKFANQFVNNSNISKDIDDWIIATETWYWYNLKVNISSYTDFIDTDSLIFLNASHQTKTVYNKISEVPMLPDYLANNLFSLIYDKIRLWLTVDIDLDHDWNVLGYKIYQSKIKNILMLNHNEFEKLLGKNSSKKLNKFSWRIKVLSKIGKILQNNRELNAKWLHNKINDNSIISVSDVVREIMILTSTLVAEFVDNINKENHIITWVFRNHMSEYENKDFDWWELDRARYDVEASYHLLLWLQKYCHFTSPIRRFPDTLLHFWINNFLNKKPQNFTKDEVSDYLSDFLNLRQDFLIKWFIKTEKDNKIMNSKQKELEEDNKIKSYIKNNKVTKTNVSDKEDFDLEINIYNFTKEDIKINNYFINEIEKRLRKKTYNKELLFILAFTKNEELINLFNKYFNCNDMKNSFVEYFNKSDFISYDFVLSFIKGKYTENWDREIKFNSYFLSKNYKDIFNNEKGLNKSEAFKKLLEFLLYWEKNYLK